MYSITHSEEFKRHPLYKPERPRYYEICEQLKPGTPLPTQNEALRLINALVQLPLLGQQQRLNVRAQLGQACTHVFEETDMTVLHSKIDYTSEIFLEQLVSSGQRSANRSVRRL